MTFPSNVVIPLEQHFSKGYFSGLTVNSDALKANRRFRDGFQAGAYLVVQIYLRKWYVMIVAKPLVPAHSLAETICHHALAISKHKNNILGLVK